jgi:hypothetical protein
MLFKGNFVEEIIKKRPFFLIIIQQGKRKNTVPGIKAGPVPPPPAQCTQLSLLYCDNQSPVTENS